MKENSKKNPYYYNKMYKKTYAKFSISHSSILPNQNNEPYSEKIKNFLIQFKCLPNSILTQSINEQKEENLHSLKLNKQTTNENRIFNNNDEQVIKYSNSNNYSFYLKRNCYYNFDQNDFDVKDKTIKINSKARPFLNKCLKELFFNRITSAHPSGVLALDFEVTLLIEKNIIVCELLMENGGKTLRSCYFNPNGQVKEEMKKNSLKYFKELVNSLEFLERRNLAHRDVKIDNILIDDNNNLRVIDFDISYDGGFHKSQSVQETHTISGYTAGFVSPEVLCYAKNSQMQHAFVENNKINPWKSDLYSCGIVGYILSGAISILDVSSFDNYKNNELSHPNYLKKEIKKSDWSGGGNDDTLAKKMNLIIKNCLEFSPSQRIRFHDLKKILKGINKKLLEDIQEQIKQAIPQGKNTKYELNEYVKELRSEIIIKEENINNMSQTIKSFNSKKQKEANLIKAKIGFNDDFLEKTIIPNLETLLSLIEECTHKLIHNYSDYLPFLKNFEESKSDIAFQDIPIEVLNLPLNIHKIAEQYCYNSSKKEESKSTLKDLKHESKIAQKTNPLDQEYKDDFNIEEIKKFISQANFEKIRNILPIEYKGRISSINDEEWKLYNLNLSKKHIFYILGMATKTINLKRIIFCFK